MSRAHPTSRGESFVTHSSGAETVRVIRGVLLDLDGTLYRGERAIPGAPEAVRALREMGAKVAFLSNKPLHPANYYAETLTRLGISATPEQVVTSGQVLGRWLAHEWPGARLYVLGEQPLIDEMTSFGLVCVNGSSRVDFVVASFDRTFTYAKLNTAYQALRHGARLVATNADRTCPVEGGQVPDAAAIIGALRGCTGMEPELVAGKPSTFMITNGLDHLGLHAEECLVVGDRLETDVRMGVEAGCATALVLTGVTNRSDVVVSPWQPDLVLKSVAHLLDCARPHPDGGIAVLRSRA
jgi:arabinose operon protein AraL